jgi:hypothetical protein
MKAPEALIVSASGNASILFLMYIMFLTCAASLNARSASDFVIACSEINGRSIVTVCNQEIIPVFSKVVVTRFSPSEVGAHQTGRCFVNDPTSTQVYVRTTLQGTAKFALPNGHQVYIIRNTKDYKGQSWALIKDWVSDDALGWVRREFILCF